MEFSLDDEKVKLYIKKAILELIQEKREVFYDLFSEVIEDMALAKAMDEGLKGRDIPGEKIISLLDEEE